MKKSTSKYSIEEHFTHMKIEFLYAIALLISFKLGLWGLVLYVGLRLLIDTYLIDKYLKIKKIPYHISLLYLLVSFIFLKAMTLLYPVGT